jgi:hypothetical protein
MPAWIHPIRLTTVANAQSRLAEACHHLTACLEPGEVAATVVVGEFPGVESGQKNRAEVQNCVAHAGLLLSALAWAARDQGNDRALVIECHGAQSSGVADLTLLVGDTALLFEASAGAGLNVKKKHKHDVRALAAERAALLKGASVQHVLTFRVVPTAAVGSLPLAARTVLAIEDEASIIQVG